MRRKSVTPVSGMDPKHIATQALRPKNFGQATSDVVTSQQRNKTTQNKTHQNQTKQDKTKQYKTRQSTPKQTNSKQISWPLSKPPRIFPNKIWDDFACALGQELLATGTVAPGSTANPRVSKCQLWVGFNGSVGNQRRCQGTWQANSSVEFATEV